MNVPIVLLVIFLGFFSTGGLSAQTSQSDQFDDWPEERGDPAIAEQYLRWAEDAIAAGQWPRALAALERAADFADVSSDISYLLALARSHENKSRGMVLQALEQAIGTGRWKHYTETQARLLEADQLIILRRYSAALDSLAAYRAAAGDDADSALLRLAALKGLSGGGPGLPKSNLAAVNLPAPVEFRRRVLETLDRYPRDPRPLRVFFSYAMGLNSAGRRPDNNDIALMEIALKRLPFVVESDPELAWMAAHFISDDDEARRLTAAYRAGSLKPRSSGDFRPNPASIVPALNLGLIDDMAAAEELFTEVTLDKDLVITIGNLLRSGEGRDFFAEKLHSFTGTIVEDADCDGYPESRAVYRQGSLQEYYHDADQDGITDLFIALNAGTPQRAELSVLPAQNGGMRALILWERYPAVQTAVLGPETFQPIPGAFRFAPIGFAELGASRNYAGLLFPLCDSQNRGINRHILASFAASVQRSSAEFEGGTEQVYLERGIPIRAEVMLNGMLVSVIEFENGSPIVQRLDLDLDGRMDTVRRFHRGNLRSSESGWNDSSAFVSNAFGSAELYREDGSIVYSWDLDGDGIREYSETRMGKQE